MNKGYIVLSGVFQVSGVRIVVQSDRSPVFLNERIENFMKITRVSIN